MKTFLLFPQCFKRLVLQTCNNTGSFGRGLEAEVGIKSNPLGISNSFPHNDHLLTRLGKKPFENIVGKGENAVHQHFLLFPKCFLLLSKTEMIISVIFILSSANAFNLDKVKILTSGNGLWEKAF